MIAHQRRAFDVAVFTVLPTRPSPIQCRPPFVLACGVATRPANASPIDGTVDLHGQLIDDGPVSAAQSASSESVTCCCSGRRSSGSPSTPRPSLALLLRTGGSRLAPLKAPVKEIAIGGGQCQVRLLHGARRLPGLYDRADLSRIAVAPQPSGALAVSDGEPHRTRLGVRGRHPTRAMAQPRRARLRLRSDGQATVTRLTQAGCARRPDPL